MILDFRLINDLEGRLVRESSVEQTGLFMYFVLWTQEVEGKDCNYLQGSTSLSYRIEYIVSSTHGNSTHKYHLRSYGSGRQRPRIFANELASFICNP